LNHESMRYSRQVTPRRDFAAHVAGAVCVLTAVCVLIQAGTLARLWHSNLTARDRPAGRAFLEQVDRTIPARASFASDVRGSGYVLYPRQRLNVSFRSSPADMRRQLEEAGVRYLVVSLPLSPSLRGAASWSRVVLRRPSALVLETSWQTG
jgi:hypothetical protein